MVFCYFCMALYIYMHVCVCMLCMYIHTYMYATPFSSLLMHHLIPTIAKAENHCTRRLKLVIVKYTIARIKKKNIKKWCEWGKEEVRGGKNNYFHKIVYVKCVWKFFFKNRLCSTVLCVWILTLPFASCISWSKLLDRLFHLLYFTLKRAQ